MDAVEEPVIADPRVQAVADLIERARESAESPATTVVNRKLLADFSVALVSAMTRIRELETQLADKPRIITPGGIL